MDVKKNAERFTGFAALYEDARPAVPAYPVGVILRHLARPAAHVVDLGCGTGLSTMAWQGHCTQVTGVEPSGDMLAVARQKRADGIHFVQAYAHDTPFADAAADVVVCSQSFHWMEPVATLAEVNRILRPGGVFATIDCDWPPLSTWQADAAYARLYQKVHALEAELPDVKDSFVRFPKEKHLHNIQSSGHFRYAREVVFANAEACTRARFAALLMSQGSLQGILKRHPQLLEADIAALQESIAQAFPTEPFPIDFSYRMRIAVK